MSDEVKSAIARLEMWEACKRAALGRLCKCDWFACVAARRGVADALDAVKPIDPMAKRRDDRRGRDDGVGRTVTA